MFKQLKSQPAAAAAAYEELLRGSCEAYQHVIPTHREPNTLLSKLMITVRTQTMGGLPQDAGCQASPLPPRNNFSQYEVRTLADGERQAVLGSSGFASFLSAVEPR